MLNNLYRTNLSDPRFNTLKTSSEITCELKNIFQIGNWF